MLELSYIPDGSDDCPLLRIAGDDLSAYSRLRDALEELSSGIREHVAIDQLPGISALHDCHLLAVAFKWNQGVIAVAPQNAFEWRLTQSTWDNVVGLLEPFSAHSTHGFQWLESAGNVRVLVTTADTW